MRPSRRQLASILMIGALASIAACTSSPGSASSADKTPAAKTTHTSTPQSHKPAVSLLTTLDDPGASPEYPDWGTFSPDGRWLAVVTTSPNANVGAVYLWSTNAWQATPLDLNNSGSEGVTSVAWAPDGRYFAAGNANGKTYVWAATGNQRVVASFTDPSSEGVSSVAWAPNGNILATGDGNGSAYVWDTTTGKRLAAVTDPGSGGLDSVSVAWSLDGKILATGDGDASAYLWDTSTYKLIGSFGAPDQDFTANSVAWAPNGRTLAIAGGDGKAYLWDTTTRKTIVTVTDPSTTSLSADVQSVAWSPNGKVLATGDQDGLTCLWDTATGAKIATITNPDNEEAFSLAFSPSGTELAVTTGDDNNDDGNIYLWRVPTD
jgi:WD40 repeat protein